MTKPVRLDAELVRRGLVPSRSEAKRAIETGNVTVRGIPVSRPTALVAPEAPIAVAGPGPRWVSRGGDKLDGALARFDIEVRGRKWLDAGASTGGFTDRLLQEGAAAVIAVDVGYGQLDWKLRNDERVVILERTNVRTLTAEELPWPPEGVTADLSFISLALVLPALAHVALPSADFILLVKPQFEVGRDRVGRGGVVRDPDLWRESMDQVAAAGTALGLGVVDAALAEPAGPAGNREFFLHLRRGVDPNEAAIRRVVSGAGSAGPQNSGTAK